MVENKVGVHPAVIVGGVLIFLILAAMVASTIRVVYRSRSSAAHANSTRRRRTHISDLERAPSTVTWPKRKPSTARRAASPSSPDLESKSPQMKHGDDLSPLSLLPVLVKAQHPMSEKEDTSIDSTTTSSSEDPHDAGNLTKDSDMPPTQSLPSRPSLAPSTLNVILSPSAPHLVKLGSGRALEVRVTPPSPVLAPTNFRFPTSGPGERDSVWWVI